MNFMQFETKVEMLIKHNSFCYNYNPETGFRSFVINASLLQIYNNHPFEKPLMEGFLLNQVKNLFR